MPPLYNYGCQKCSSLAMSGRLVISDVGYSAMTWFIDLLQLPWKYCDAKNMQPRGRVLIHVWSPKVYWPYHKMVYRHA